MLLLSYMIQHYFSIPYEDFTSKIITAYGLLNAVDGVPREDLNRIKWIQENTHKDVMVSLWKLDRAVNPTKGEFQQVSFKRRFIRNDAQQTEFETGGGYVELTDDMIQQYLCEAITEVHVIVIKNIKGYKEEMKLDIIKGFEVSKEIGKLGFT